METVKAKRSVQTYGRKKTAVAVSHVTDGEGLIKVNGSPLKLVEPVPLRLKVYEPILLLGKDTFANVNIRIRVKGGGYTAQVYAIRQAIARGILAWNQKYVDEATKNSLKEILIGYDRTLLIADFCGCEFKKFGGKGACARFQKSYR